MAQGDDADRGAREDFSRVGHEAAHFHIRVSAAALEEVGRRVLADRHEAQAGDPAAQEGHDLVDEPARSVRIGGVGHVAHEAQMRGALGVMAIPIARRQARAVRSIGDDLDAQGRVARQEQLALGVGTHEQHARTAKDRQLTLREQACFTALESTQERVARQGRRAFVVDPEQVVRIHDVRRAVSAG